MREIDVRGDSRRASILIAGAIEVVESCVILFDAAVAEIIAVEDVALS